MRVQVPTGERLALAAVCAVGIVAAGLIRAGIGECAWFPPCPTHHFLGIYCPGCGTTRALTSLLRGDLGQAWAFNPLVLVVLPGFAVWFMNTLLGVVLGWKVSLRRTPSFAGWLFLGVMVCYTLLRNVPLESTAWLRPHRLDSVVRGDSGVSGVLWHAGVGCEQVDCADATAPGPAKGGW